MNLAPFALLIAALAVFLISTRQLAIGLRIAFCLAGTAVLAAAAWFALLDPGHLSFLRLAIQQPGTMLEAFGANRLTVGAALAPMFDVLMLLAAAAGIACFIALTPGDAIERAIRPFKIALIGAIAGGLLALALTGVGFGQLVKRDAYISVGKHIEVIDGDTIRMGDVSLRLWGIDAPEMDGCKNPADRFACGTFARNELVRLIGNSTVLCTAMKEDSRGAPTESFGRPLMKCSTVSNDDERIDLSEALARGGFADVYRKDGRIAVEDYACDVADAQRAARGMWLSPRPGFEFVCLAARRTALPPARDVR